MPIHFLCLGILRSSFKSASSPTVQCVWKSWITSWKHERRSKFEVLPYRKADSTLPPMSSAWIEKLRFLCRMASWNDLSVFRVIQVRVRPVFYDFSLRSRHPWGSTRSSRNLDKESILGFLFLDSRSLAIAMPLPKTIVTSFEFDTWLESFELWGFHDFRTFSIFEMGQAKGLLEMWSVDRIPTRKNREEYNHILFVW